MSNDYSTNLPEWLRRTPAQELMGTPRQPLPSPQVPGRASYPAGMSASVPAAADPFTTSHAASTSPRNLNREERELLLNRLLLEHVRNTWLAPVALYNGAPTTVLDAGCGVGAWVDSVAARYFNNVVEVVGSDLEPPPTGLYHQRQVRFVRADLRQRPTPYFLDHFDLVYMRDMIFDLSVDEWPEVIKGLVRLTRPGGFLEFTEFSNVTANIPPKYYRQQGYDATDSGFYRLTDWCWRLCNQRGWHIFPMNDLQEWLQAAGTWRISEQQLLIPLGGAPGTVGALMADYYPARLEVLAEHIVAAGLAPTEQVQLMLQRARQEAHDCRIEVGLTIVSAQRPRIHAAVQPRGHW